MSTDTIAFTLALSGAFFLTAAAAIEAVLWIDDRLSARRRKRAAK